MGEGERQKERGKVGKDGWREGKRKEGKEY